MTPIEVTALTLAGRFIGVTEAAGHASNPMVLAMLQLDQQWPEGDDVPWCSGFANYIAWLLELPRSKSLAARSWLSIGRAVGIHEAEPGFDVVIFKRGGGLQPGPEVIQASGHVAFYMARKPGLIQVVGGNQSDAVTVASYPISRVLGIRRIRE